MTAGVEVTKSEVTVVGGINNKVSLNHVPPDQVAGSLRKEAVAFEMKLGVDRLNQLETWEGGMKSIKK